MDSTGLKECSKCKNLVPDSEPVCDQCGNDDFTTSNMEGSLATNKLLQQSKLRLKKKSTNKKILLIRNLIAGTFLVCFFYGEFHFVHGSTYTGKSIIPKVSFSFSETFVNTDQILNVPVIAAKSNWPLAVAALQREGFLESDIDRERRIKSEFEAEVKKNQAAAEAEFKKSQQEAEEQAKRDLYKLEHGKYPDQ